MLRNFIILCSLVFVINGQIIISEVADGTESGGKPKMVELTNSSGTDLDLSGYAIKVYANGGTTETATARFTFTSFTLAAGASVVVTNASSTEWASYSLAIPSNIFYDAGVNSNGDDVYALANDLDVNIDLYGRIGEDGTGKDWEFLDSYAYRKTTVVNPNSVFTVSEWEILPVNTLDNQNGTLGNFLTPGTHNFGAAGYTFTSIPLVTNIQLNSADIAFSASDSSIVTIYYGLSVAYTDSVKITSAAKTFLTTISGLTESTLYHVKVKITKKDLTESNESADLTFTSSSPVVVVSVSDIVTNFSIYDGQTVTILGTVLNDFGNLQTSRTNIYIVSNTGYAINFSSSTLYNTLKRGDLIQVTGEVGVFRKVIQIEPTTDPSVISSGNPIPEPRKVSTEEVNNHTALGQYVEVIGFVEDSYNTGSSGGNIELNDGSGTAIARVWSTTGLSAVTAKIDERFRLRGAIGTFVTGGDTVTQILPSVNSDIELFTNTIDDTGIGVNSLSVEAMTFDIDNSNPVRFQFKIRDNSRAVFSIYDMSGKRIKTLDSKTGTGSLQEASWNKLNNQYQRVRIGTYILYMEVTEENGKKISKHVPVVIGARL
jgi:hypothetical protein